MGSCFGPLLLAPGVMTLVRGWLLFLAFDIDLAQKNLEEVPVQPDFDARKVSVTARPSQGWDEDWVQVTLSVCSSRGRGSGSLHSGALADTGSINSGFFPGGIESYSPRAVSEVVESWLWKQSHSQSDRSPLE